MRMQAKKNTDHLLKPSPKAAENVDTNRAAHVCPAESLEEAYDKANAAFGEPIRVKNNYSPNFDAVGGPTKGYRCLLANYLWGPPGATWGDHVAEIEAATEELKEIVAKTDQLIGDTVEGVQKRAALIDQAAACFRNPELSMKPARLIVEIQFMATEYLEMRKHTHAWYKIDRAENALGLMYDFIGGLGDD